MRKILTILAIFTSMIFGGVFLTSCSKSVKNMYLQVEYCVAYKGADGEWNAEPWEKVDGRFDHTLSSDSRLFLKINVKGTSKKIKSLYISQSVNNSIILKNNTVKPGETFEVLVTNIGSVEFNVTPGGYEDRSMSFGMDIYRKLTGIEQNVNCVPALVVGGNIELDNLKNLIKYYPYNETIGVPETNQTGVDYTIAAIGTLPDNGSETGLLDRTFVPNTDYEAAENQPEGSSLFVNKGDIGQSVKLARVGSSLKLSVSTKYMLGNNNNVIKLTATSQHDSERSADIYVYIVENFTNNSLLVSYNPSINLDDNGDLPNDEDVRKPVDDNVTLYNSLIVEGAAGTDYGSMKVYTYTNKSIYSYESNPGIRLLLYINGEQYDYTTVSSNSKGLEVSPIYRGDELVGLKFSVDPNVQASTNTYKVRIELDFTAFDFSASDKKPVETLNKEFTINVEKLVSEIYINGKSYKDNSDVGSTPINGYNSSNPAKLYTSYDGQVGMPLNIQAVPNDAINSAVYVSFYKKAAVGLGESLNEVLKLYESQDFPLDYNNGEYVVDFVNKNKVVYLAFDGDVVGIDSVLMVCKAVCTPETFDGQVIGKDYITFIAEIDVAGGINDISLHKTSNAPDALEDDYLRNNYSNVAYIDIKSNSTNVDYTEVLVTSAGGNIKFSADGNEWSNSIAVGDLGVESQKHKLYFRTSQQCKDSIVVSAPNGVWKGFEYEFVNIVAGGADNVKVEFDKTYITHFNADTPDYVSIDGIVNTEIVTLNYLALQSGRTVQFNVLGDNRGSNIKSVNARSLRDGNDEYAKIKKGGNALYTNALLTFNPSAIKVSNTGNYLFDVRANTVGHTAVLFVQTEFYVENAVGSIELQTKYFIYEVAVYTPARELTITTDKDSILYINDYYPNSALVEIGVAVNSTATKTLKFSSDDVNNSINLDNYGEDISRIYATYVSLSENAQEYVKDGYFQVDGVTSPNEGRGYVSHETRKFTIKALKSLKDLQDEGETSIYFDVTIYQFGEKTTYQLRKVIYFGDYEKSTGIIVDGVDAYNNAYLSLLNGEDAKIIKASVANSNATYKDLGYRLWIDNNGNRTAYTGTNLSITRDYDNAINMFEINATNEGGVYVLELYAQDSYDEDKGDYAIKHYITINVSDGASEETAYLITSLDEFKKIADNSTKHYRLAKDIDISALNDADWWSKERSFSGTLDGAMTIVDLNTNVTITKCYALIGLNINKAKALSDANCFGLFSSVIGTIKNIVFDRVAFDVELTNENTSNLTTNIGAITAINNGTIENCSVNIVSSSIVFNGADDGETLNDANNTTYNIGLIAGLNNKTIKYNNTNVGSNYAYMTDCNSGGKLTILVQAGNNNFEAATQINIGAVAGNNGSGAEITAGYEDGSSQSVRTLISIVANIELKAEYNQNHAPMDVNTNFGGVAGYNEGTIKNIAVSGRLVANDKVNMGGVVGANTGTIQEVANYGAYIEGYALVAGYQSGEGKSIAYYSVNPATDINQEQNIGGIVGFNNAGTVDNVRVIFIHFTNDEVAVASSEAEIKGVGNVSGVIGKASNTQLTRAYVENFIKDEGDLTYNIMGSNANLAGLIANGSGNSTVLSFVQADVNMEGCLFHEFGKDLAYSYVYFIGDVWVDGITRIIPNHNTAPEGISYIINYVVYKDGKETAKNAVINGVNNIVLNTNNLVDRFTIQWRKSTNEGINDNQPYLVYIDGGVDYYTLTVQPTEIIVNVDENYFDENADKYKVLDAEPADWSTNWKDYYEKDGDDKYKKLTGASAPTFEEDKYYKLVFDRFEVYDDGLYLQYNDTNNNDEIVATAIVYYIDGANNRHQLVSDGEQKGLIEKTVLPNISAVNGSYSVSIISGAQIASLTDSDKTITFFGTGKVELKFISLFDRSIQDTVVIFVENPISENVFNISTGSGMDDRTGKGENFSTRVGVNSLVSLNLDKVNGQTFDTSKTYMKSSFTALSGASGTVYSGNKDDYFTFTAITNEVATGKYALGQFEMQALEVPASEKYLQAKSEKYLQATIELSVYLNLAKYNIGDNTLQELIGDNRFEALLETKTITITIYNKATGLSVSSDVRAESGVSVNISAELKTGYIGSLQNGTPTSSSDGNRSYIDVEGQDKVDLVLTAENENARDLVETASVNSIWDLFKVIISYEKLSDGYRYGIHLTMKEEYRYLDVGSYTDREWRFELEIIANSNYELTKTVDIAFAPQQLTSFRLENYSNLISKAGENAGTTEAEFESSEVESSLIIPGGSGLIKIFAEHSYSYFEDVSISFTSEDASNEYIIRFQQMVYNKNTERYESYAGITANGESLALKKVSYINESGEYEYDGVIFVRTLLDKMVGIRKTFTINVNATTYDLQGNSTTISRSKTLISQYKPGVYISVTNALTTTDATTGEVGYLVEQTSSVTNIVAKVYGYEFNVQPTVSVKAINAGDTITAEDIALIRTGEVVKDNTGAYILTYALGVYTDKPFEISMKMSLVDDGNTLTETSETLKFYPVPYIINDVRLKGETNGGLDIAVNSSKNLELEWSTKVTTNEKIEAINNTIKTNVDIDFLKLFYIDAIDAGGMDYKKYFNQYLNATDTNFSVKKNGDGTYRIESLIQSSPIIVHFNIWYGYEKDASGKMTVKFSNEYSEICKYSYSHDFRLLLTLHTTEEAPDPITSQEDLLAMSPGENYILMNDITLEHWVPLNTAIASFDGNGKVINIKSFNIAVQSSLNVGLFDTISADTIIKNVVINIGTMNNNLGQNQTAMYISDDNIANANINFGLLAGTNLGLVYNCEVLSLSVSRTLEVAIGTGYTLTFGGLVGVNQGNITNSRVGTEYFERLTEGGGNVASVKVDCGSLYFKSKGVMGGLVGHNGLASNSVESCIISSCFVANTTIENTSTNSNSAINRTAGFVATNNGLVAYSYVKGLERSIINTRARATGAKVYSSGSGVVAGFAYINNGEIHDCYSNIICESNSSAVAGFVYDTTNGVTAQCYSASTVINSNQKEDPLATEMPFVGVSIEKQDAQKLLSNDKMVNCYYLDDGESYDAFLESPDRAEPESISLLSFADSTKLNNYSFISEGLIDQQLNGVWTYSTACDKNRSTYGLGYTSLPELTSANTIARSLRVYDGQQNVGGLHNYKYPAGYEQGSKNNPYTISNADEYKDVLVTSAPSDAKGIKYKAGYVRFVDNISFASDGKYANIDTRSNYILGDKLNNTFTLIDGNGMTISDVVINYANDDKGSLGLFSEVYYSVIKGLNIKYASQSNSDGSEVGSATVTYAGGVAGTARNTYFIDIDLMGSVTLRAHNVIGGVVGKLTGPNSGLYNITTELNVQAGNYSNSNRYINEQSEPSYLSYAGGIAGIVDIGSDRLSPTIYNVRKLTVNSSNVRANRAGGIAGYLGANVNAIRLTYYIDGDSQVFGREVAGGIVADNFADIELSQANRDIEEQYAFDKAFGKYINDDDLIDFGEDAESTYGNLSAVTGEMIVGGFIGVNYAGNVTKSLTKANIGHNDDYGLAKTVGGFIGKTYGGDLQQVYAQNYIELVYDMPSVDGGSTTKYVEDNVGGLVGVIANETADRINLGDKSKTFGLDNVVVATWFEKSQVENYSKEYPNKLDYIAGSVDGEVKIQFKATDDNSPVIRYGVFNADEDKTMYKGGLIQNRHATEKHLNKALSYSMNDLYSIASDGADTSLQRDVFNELFISWDVFVWDLNPDKFMPNLKEDNETDYIPIESKADLIKLQDSPNKNFILVKDVNVGEYSNYVVNAEFTGVLIAALKEDKTYTKFYNITLNADVSNHPGSGFFKSTRGARITNVTFEYAGINLTGNGYEKVGGVSASDEDSRFEQVKVNKDKQESCFNGSGTVTGAVGSIVGDSTRSKIITCSSDIAYDLKAEGSDAYIGGLVGKINGSKEDGGKIIYDGLISSSTYSGKIKVASNTGANVGGIAGSADYATIGTTNAKIDIDLDNQGTTNVGGIVAIMKNNRIDDSSAEINISGTAETCYIGGIASKVVSGKTEKYIIDGCYADITYDLSLCTNAFVGGIIGEISSEEVKINAIVGDVKITEASSTEYMTVGGIVAVNSATGTTINNAMSIMNCTIVDSARLIGGGIIGQATAKYTIDNCTSMGLLATHSTTTPGGPTLTVLGGLVGLADEVADLVLKNKSITEQVIKNSYTVLTISTAGLYKGTDPTNSKSHDVYANAVIGYTYGSGIISGNSILYSSDYTLVFEKGEEFGANKPINVTAKVLTQNEQTLYKEDPNESEDPNALINKGCIGDGWRWKNNYLPIPVAVTDQLGSMGILSNGEFAEQHKGQPYYPIPIDDFSEDRDDIDGVNYKYYLLIGDNNEEITGDNVGLLNGVLLGNNQVIKLSSNGLFGEITQHSAVSNITLIGAGTIANINHGTIFMCGVQYEDLTVSNGFGGIAGTNNGNISNCYNMGNATTASEDVGGIANVNTIYASIEDCYFTGSFAGGAQGSAFADHNEGYIARGYSAGMAKNFIGNLEPSLDVARYSDILFDYYANYITNKAYESLESNGIIGKSTSKMQEVKASDSLESAVLAGWHVYSMSNWNEINDKIIDEKYGAIDTTYNYGYPIHNFIQLTCNNIGENIEWIPIRVKKTGNGTFINITEDNNNDGYITADDAKGKFVSSTYIKDGEGEVTEYYDSRPFLINNLGLLDLINKVERTAGLYFELEISIVMPTEELEEGDKYKEENDNPILSAWPGIGNATPFRGVFTTSVRGNELNRALLDDEDGFEAEANIIALQEDETPKTIENLHGSLFAKVDGAVIANVVLKDSVVTEIGGAPLINEVTGGSTYVLNAGVEGELVADESNNSYMAGLINIVSSGSLYLHSVIYKDVELDTKEQLSSVAGVIYKNYGTVNIKNSFTEATDIKIKNIGDVATAYVAGFVYENGENSNGKINIINNITITPSIEGGKPKGFSGFVGINKGDILTLDGTSTININKIDGEEYIAGFAGRMYEGTIGGFNIKFNSNERNAYSTDMFGGVVVYLHGGNIGDSENEGEGDDLPINVQLSCAKANVFGGVVAETKDVEGQPSASASIKNVEIDKKDEVIGVESPNSSQDDAYGLVVGRYGKNMFEINYSLASNMKFKVNKGNNVGGIVGVASTGGFIFTNDKPETVMVYGVNNVGGFIGKYEGSESLLLGDKDWVIGEELYAKVEIALPEGGHNGVKSEMASGFGGLIGCWAPKGEGSITLECRTSDNGAAQVAEEPGEGEGADDKLLEIINPNSVLTFDGVASEMDWFKNIEKTRGYDYVVQHVGGVVGKSNAGISKATNKGIIGTDLDLFNVGDDRINVHNGKNPIYGTVLEEGDATINKFMQFMYIGGVAGYIDGKGNTSLVTDCKMEGGVVYGMYGVGGLIGGVKGDVTIGISADNEDIEQGEDNILALNGAVVVGLADVGGFIGRIDEDGQLTVVTHQEEGAEEDGIKIGIAPGKIVGLANVGGVVGYAGKVNISNIEVRISEDANDTTTRAIMGNLNVGGIIGYATNAQVTNCSTSATVYGTVFDYAFDVEGENKVFYYLPLNIGGAVGYAASGSTFKEVYSNANVLSDKNYETVIESECVVVNMTENYHGNIDNIESREIGYGKNPAESFSNYIISYYSDSGEAPKAVKYDALDGGIGGFAGRLDNAEFNIPENQAGETKYSDSKISGNIYAEYGINVGGMVGYLNNDRPIALPASPNEIDGEGNPETSLNVAGKLFVGGYIGKINAFSASAEDFFMLNPVGIINVQRYNGETVIGNCVGGVVGYSAGEVKNINMAGSIVGYTGSPIKIYNSIPAEALDSSYIGVIVGRLDGNMSNCGVTRDLCNDNSGIIVEPKTFNYGALVGLANVPKNSNVENPFKVQGVHYYPFTIYMIQNQDYIQGESQYSYSGNVLTANAHYINASHIQVSATADSTLYGNDAHNPTNEKANGWAKEYTMFKMMARIIPQDILNEKNEPIGDSVQIIYNADYITEVGMDYYGGKIMYTIYQPIGQTAKLYCRYGIAEYAPSFDTTPLDLTKGFMDWGLDTTVYSYEANHQVELSANGYYWTGAGYQNNRNTYLEREFFWTHIDSIEKLGGEVKDGKVAIGGHDAYGEVGFNEKNAVNDVAKTYNYTFGYTYYDAGGSANAKDNYLQQGGNHYFVFTTIFGFAHEDYSLDDVDVYTDKAPELKHPDMYSKSGSLFEVTGTVGSLEGDIELKGTWSWLDEALLVGAVIVATIFVIATGGATLLAFATTVAAKIALGVALSIGIGAGLLAPSANNLYNAIESAGGAVREAYLSMEETSMGYLYSTYGRNISWNNGKLDASMDAVISIDVNGVKLNHPEGYEGPSAEDLSDTFKNVNTNTDYQKYLVDRLNILGDRCSMTLPYFACSSGRVNPELINNTVTVNVDDLHDYSEYKKIFEALSIESYEVPQYQLVDDDLYVYAEAGKETRTLYANYAHVSKNAGSLGITENTLIDEQGYAYLLNIGDNKDHMVPSSDTNYLQGTFGISRIINREASVNITDSMAKAIRKTDALGNTPYRTFEEDVKSENIVWKIGGTGGGSFKKQIGFKYYGTNSPSENEYVVLDAIKTTEGVFIENGMEYVNLATNETSENLPGDERTNVRAYFSVNGTGDYVIERNIQPVWGGYGLTYNQAGYEESDLEGYYYEYATEGGQLTIDDCEYVLCRYTEYDGKILGTDQYAYDDIANDIDDEDKYNEFLSLELKVYEKKDTSNAPDGLHQKPYTEDMGVDQFYGAETIHYRDLISDPKYWKYSLSNKSYKPVSDYYKLDATGKIIGRSQTSLIVDREREDASGSIYLYTASYEQIFVDNNYTGRYVYIGAADGGQVYLYTRFKYHDGDNQNDFMGHMLGSETIWSILQPRRADVIDNKDVVFAESVRVSLSAYGQTVYTDYKNNKTVSGPFGSISYI